MSATTGEMLTPDPNECYSTLTSETRDINLTRRRRYPVHKSIAIILEMALVGEDFLLHFAHISDILAGMFDCGMYSFN